MRKLCLLVLVLLVFSGTVFAQRLDVNMFVSSIFNEKNTKNFEEILIASRIGFGISYDYALLPLLSPGIEGQIAYCPFGSMLKENVILFDASARIYNGMHIARLELQPFLGYMFKTATANATAYNASRIELGLRIIISFFSLELAWFFPGQEIIIPAFGSFVEDLPVVNAESGLKVVLSWHLKNR